MTFEEMQLTIQEMLTVQRDLQSSQLAFSNSLSELSTDILELRKSTSDLRQSTKDLNEISQRNQKRFERLIGNSIRDDRDWLDILERVTDLELRVNRLENSQES